MKYSFYVKHDDDLVYESMIYDENDKELSQAAKRWETPHTEYRQIICQVVFVEHSDTLNK